MKTRLILAFLTAATSALLSSVSLAEESGYLRQTSPVAQMLASGAAHHSDFKNSENAASLATRLSAFEETLQSDPSLAREVASRAFRDAFGIDADAANAPTAAENGSGNLYYQRMQAHHGWLEAQPEAYDAVIHRAYQWVVHREAYEEELEYWKERPTLTYILLVGCVEDWARRNQPGLMVTAGTPTISVNCPYLETIRLSPEMAAEARSAIGLEPVSDGVGPIIAAGAEGVTSSGGTHFITVGNKMLRDAAR